MLSTNQKVSGSISGSPSAGVEVSLGNILNPKLLLMAASSVIEWLLSGRWRLVWRVNVTHSVALSGQECSAFTIYNQGHNLSSRSNGVSWSSC